MRYKQVSRSIGSLAIPALGWAVLFLAASPLHAQTHVVTKRANLTLSGKLHLAAVYRNDEMFEATKGTGGNTPGNPPTGSIPVIEPGLDNSGQSGLTTADDHDEFYLDPNISLRFDVEVQDRVKGVIELRTPFFRPDAGGKNGSPIQTGGSFSGFRDRTLELKQVYAEIGNMFWEGLSIRAGIQDFRKDLRGKGDAFVIDVAGSENPFDGAIAFDSDGNGSLESVGGGRIRTSTGFADTLEAAGGLITQTFGSSTTGSRPLVKLDAWAFSIDQRYRASGADGPTDKYFWGVSGDIYFGKDGQYGKVMLMVFDLMNGTDSPIFFTAGGGFDFYPLGQRSAIVWEVFAEAYGQGGEYDSHHLPDGSDLDQKEGFAVEGGTRLAFPIDIGESRQFLPYVEVSYVEVSGDSDHTDGTNQNFVSLENNNRTLIVENGYYGYDIDTNYRGARVAFGFDHKVSNEIGLIHFELLYAYLEWQDNGGGRISGGTTESEKIGDEIDITISWEYSPALQIGLKSGWLLDAKALGESQDIHMTIFEILLSF